MEIKERGYEGVIKQMRQKKPLGEARFSEEKKDSRRIARRRQTVVRPRKVARRSGIPNRVSVIRSAASVRALRASRSSHDKRECARSAREIVGEAEAEVLLRVGSIWI